MAASGAVLEALSSGAGRRAGESGLGGDTGSQHPSAMLSHCILLGLVAE